MGIIQSLAFAASKYSMKISDAGFHSAHSAALLLSRIFDNSREGLFDEKKHIEIEIPVAVGLEASLALSYLTAFSVELGIKTILMDVGLEVPRTHDLLKLFRRLPEIKRNEIAADVCAKEGYSSREFDTILSNNRCVFMDWRYFHELSIPNLTDPGFLLSLATTIRKSNQNLATNY
jgi:hypothetical protein